MKRSESIEVNWKYVLEKYEVISNDNFIADYFRAISPFKLFSNFDVNSDLLNDDEVIYLFEDMSKEDYDKLNKLVMKYYIWQ